jgi:DNA-binding HxlR family transcriptional regulator
MAARAELHADEGSWADEVGEGAFDPNFHAASELIGKRWTGAIIRTLFHGHTRFREIAEAVPGLSDKLLSARLKELVAHGIVCADADERGYVLTEKGQDLRLVLIELARWAHRWRGDETPTDSTGIETDEADA